MRTIIVYIATSADRFIARRGGESEGAMQNRHIGLLLWSGALLCGCAGGTQAAAARDAEPDCSFRAPTTCWTVSGRFPASRNTAPQPELDPRRDSSVLASRADTASAR
jgi:hypothetical protein